MADVSLSPEALFLEEPDLSASDPTCAGGYTVVYDKECPFEMRVQESDEAPMEVGTLEAIRCKVAVAGDAAAPTAVKLELSSETDLFFHYTHVADDRSFRGIREEQHLMIELADYANVLIRSLNQAIKEPHTHLAVFIMSRDANARLDFIANMEYKFVELLSVNFNRSADDVIRSAIAFRYNAVKSKLALVQDRLRDVTQIVKLKNPSLLLQLQKPGAGAGVGVGAGLAASSSGGAAAAASASSAAMLQPQAQASFAASSASLRSSQRV